MTRPQASPTKKSFVNLYPLTISSPALTRGTAGYQKQLNCNLFHFKLKNICYYVSHHHCIPKNGVTTVSLPSGITHAEQPQLTVKYRAPRSDLVMFTEISELKTYCRRLEPLPKDILDQVKIKERVYLNLRVRGYLRGTARTIHYADEFFEISNPLSLDIVVQPEHSVFPDLRHAFRAEGLQIGRGLSGGVIEDGYDLPYGIVHQFIFGQETVFAIGMRDILNFIERSRQGTDNRHQQEEEQENFIDESLRNTSSQTDAVDFDPVASSSLIFAPDAKFNSNISGILSSWNGRRVFSGGGNAHADTNGKFWPIYTEDLDEPNDPRFGKNLSLESLREARDGAPVSLIVFNKLEAIGGNEDDKNLKIRIVLALNKWNVAGLNDFYRKIASSSSYVFRSPTAEERKLLLKAGATQAMNQSMSQAIPQRIFNNTISGPIENLDGRPLDDSLKFQLLKRLQGKFKSEPILFEHGKLSAKVIVYRRHLKTAAHSMVKTLRPTKEGWKKLGSSDLTSIIETFSGEESVKLFENYPQLKRQTEHSILLWSKKFSGPNKGCDRGSTAKQKLKNGLTSHKIYFPSANSARYLVGSIKIGFGKGHILANPAQGNPNNLDLSPHFDRFYIYTCPKGDKFWLYSQAYDDHLSGLNINYLKLNSFSEFRNLSVSLNELDGNRLNFRYSTHRSNQATGYEWIFHYYGELLRE